MLSRWAEGSDHGAPLTAFADKARPAATAQCQTQGIEQNGFSRPRLAGQNTQPGTQIKIKLIDQYNIRNGQRA
jgi:hypothetical protein